MTGETERRQHQRHPCDPPRVAAVRPLGGGEPALFVSVPDLSAGGARLQSHLPLAADGELELALLDQEHCLWERGRGRVAWSRGLNGGRMVQTGLALAEPLRPAGESVPDLPGAADLAFVLGTRLVRYLPPEAACPLLNCLKPLALAAGQRFITQGDQGDSLFIIQEGLCSVKIPGEDGPRTVAQLRGGDVVGEMALLTGGERSASVDAETDMRVWELNRADFDQVAAEHPDLREFLTELLTERVDKSPVMAVRNVGRYTMVSRLGRGGYSLVYRGRHRNLNMTVAIKMLKHNLAMDEDFLERFRDEGRIIAGLNHPNIVKVFDIIERYRTIFIMMEYLEGEPLSAVMERGGALPLGRALNMLRQICRGLDYAHRQGIVHLDVKPANIYVLPDDQIKILDFGLASTQGDDDAWLTGTPQYMSPEQIEGEPVDGRTDVYSLGLTAFEMLLGHPPFASEEVAELLRLHLNAEVPDPALLSPDLPPAVRDFIIRASRRDPEARFQSMAEAEAALPSPGAAAAAHATEAGRRVTVLLIPHDESQQLALNQLLDEFSARAEALGLKLTIAGQGEV